MVSFLLEHGFLEYPLAGSFVKSCRRGQRISPQRESILNRLGLARAFETVTEGALFGKVYTGDTEAWGSPEEKVLILSALVRRHSFPIWILTV